MDLGAIVDKLDDIPEDLKVRDLFTEKNGKWELTGIKGVKTEADILRVTQAHNNEKKEHAKTKERLDAWGELLPDDVKTKLDRMTELEEAAKGKLDDAKIDEIANRRADAIFKTQKTPLDRKITNLEKERDALKEAVTKYAAVERKRTIKESMAAAMIEAKIVEDVRPDVQMYEVLFDVVEEEGQPPRVVTKEGVGVTPGLDPKAWLMEMVEKRPHWQGPTQGTGARGASPSGIGTPAGGNPWSHENWNLTRQGQYLKAHGMERARQMAQAAGTIIGGARPSPKSK